MDNSDKLLWLYLIKKGGLLESESYYGNIIDIEGTKQLREAIKKDGSIINWKKSTPVVQDTDYKFLGTFADEDDKVEHLKGELVIKNKKYKFYLELQDMSIKSVIADVMQDSVL